MYKIRVVYAEGSIDEEISYYFRIYSFVTKREKILSRIKNDPAVSGVYTYKLGWRGWRVIGSY